MAPIVLVWESKLIRVNAALHHGKMKIGSMVQFYNKCNYLNIHAPKFFGHEETPQVTEMKP